MKTRLNIIAEINESMSSYRISNSKVTEMLTSD